MNRPVTPDCRCYGCGDSPMACGALCADCSWDDHLAGMAHTGASWADGPSHETTPACCLLSRDEEAARWASGDES